MCALLVLECGALVNGLNEHGSTPLMLAAAGGHQSVVSLLARDLSADVRLRRRDGFTALHVATKAGHVECTAVLVKCGADPNTPTSTISVKPKGVGAAALHLSGSSGLDWLAVELGLGSWV